MPRKKENLDLPIEWTLAQDYRFESAWRALELTQRKYEATFGTSEGLIKYNYEFKKSQIKSERDLINFERHMADNYGIKINRPSATQLNKMGLIAGTRAADSDITLFDPNKHYPFLPKFNIITDEAGNKQYEVIGESSLFRSKKSLITKLINTQNELINEVKKVVNIDKLSEHQQALIFEGTILHKANRSTYSNPESILYAEEKLARITPEGYAQRYKEAWKENHASYAGYQEVVDVIDKLLSTKKGRLELLLIFNTRRRVEAQIAFLYEKEEETDLGAGIPTFEKRRDVLRFWKTIDQLTSNEYGDEPSVALLNYLTQEGAYISNPSKARKRK